MGEPFIPIDMLESIASWALERQCELVDRGWGRSVAQMLSAQDEFTSWAAWFRGWDVKSAGCVPPGVIGLALNATIRATTDRLGASAAALLDAWSKCTLASWMEGDLPMSLSVFLGEVAPLVSAVMRDLETVSAGRARDSPSTSPCVSQMNSPATDSRSHYGREYEAEDSQVMSTPGGGTREKCEAVDGPMCCTTSRCLCGEQRVAQLPLSLRVGELPVVVRLLSMDSLGLQSGSFDATPKTKDGFQFYFAGCGLSDPGATLMDVGIKSGGAISILIPRQPVQIDGDKNRDESGRKWWSLTWAGALLVMALATALNER